ncbi:MAG: hypothetical protein EOP05_00800 [Proteobacteria bacterium]|nr:MAG: hypothetical protein EOP05_00800 [Pseudomonadota bacterium]
MKKVVDALLFERWWATYQKAFLQHKKKLKKLRLSKVERQEFENTYTASFPEPAVRITSVSDKFAATEAIAPFKIIKSVSYTALKTNNEDADGEEALLKLHREFMAKLNGTSADMGFENAADGLDKEKVEDLVIAASASAGNAEYVVRGNAVDGSSLRITEDDSRVKLDVKVPADATVTDLGAAIFRKLDDAILSGTIKINTSNAVKTERERATELIRKINRGQR